MNDRRYPDPSPRPPVYVDALMRCVPNRNWRYTQACHLFVDTRTDIETLHEFARKIGLNCEWFQGAHALPHYDLSPGKRKVAVACGAIELDRTDTVRVLRRWREIAQTTQPRQTQGNKR